jgi:hypothetical protein
MGRDGDSSGFDDCLDRFSGACTCNSIAIARRTDIAHSSEQPFHIRTSSARIEKSQQVEPTLHGDLHAREEHEGPKARRVHLLHPLVSLLETIDPCTGVVIGDRDAVNTGSHELAQPALGCHLLVSADGLLPGAGV